MRPDCTLQQLARGYISFNHLQQEGKEDGCNNPFKPASTNLILLLGNWDLFLLACTIQNPEELAREKMSMRQAKWGAQIFKEWQSYLLHMSNYILLVKMAWRSGRWSGSRVKCSLGKAGKVMKLMGLQSCCSSAWSWLWEGLIGFLHFLLRFRNVLEREFCLKMRGNTFRSAKLPPAFWDAAIREPCLLPSLRFLCNQAPQVGWWPTWGHGSSHEIGASC